MNFPISKNLRNNQYTIRKSSRNTDVLDVSEFIKFNDDDNNCLDRLTFLANFMLALSVIITLGIIFSPTLDSVDNKKGQVWINNSGDVYSNSSETVFKSKELPQAIIIGARKCGTRALLKFLQINPSIKSAKKEIHFFDKPENYKLGIDWYKKQMPFSSKNEITIEKSPAYFVTDGVPERIKSMNSTVKLILILRDPVTRLISDFSQLVANKIESKKSHDKLGEQEEDLYYSDGTDYTNESDNNKNLINKASWLEAETSFEDYVRRPDGGIDDQRRAVKIGMYSIYLEKWLTLFSKEQFHFVDGENLILKPYEELKKLETFLGLKPTIKEQDFIFNQRKGFYCIKTNNTILVNDKNNTNSTNSAVLNNANEIQQAGNNITFNCLSKSKGRRHVNVKKDLIEDLKKFYAPYNEYLYTLTGLIFN